MAPAYLLRLQLRAAGARLLGAHEHVLDELLDTEQPHTALIQLLTSRYYPSNFHL